MVRVSKDDARAELFERVLRQSLYGGGGADRHERGRFEGAVRRREFASARAGWVGLGNLERKAHFYIVVRTSLLPNSKSTNLERMALGQSLVRSRFDRQNSGEYPRQHGKEQNKRGPRSANNSKRLPDWDFFRVGG